jgi:hypothetical protein
MTSLIHLLAAIPFLHPLLAQTDYPITPEGGGAVGAIGGIIWLAVVILALAGLWKVFVKAGKPGWAAIIPIYNLVVLLQIVGKPLWWIILMFIPLVNLIILILVMIALAKSFGKGAGYGIGLALLGFIFIPMLGFDDSKYLGPQP